MTHKMTLLVVAVLVLLLVGTVPVAAQMEPGETVVIVEENPVQDWILVAVVFGLAFVIWTQQNKLTQFSEHLRDTLPAWAADILRDVAGGGTDQLVRMTQKTPIEWDDQIAAYIDEAVERLLAAREQDEGAADVADEA